MSKLLFPLLMIALFCACHPPKDVAPSSPYDRQLMHYVKLLQGEKKKTKHLQGLETAFQQAQMLDLFMLDSLLEENCPDLWPAVNTLHRRLQTRQQKVTALEPLRSPAGYTPTLHFVTNIADREADSRRQAAGYLYGSAQTLLSEAVERHNPPAAREAFYALQDLKKNYYRYWENANALYDSSLSVGVTQVLLTNLPGTDSLADRSFWGNVSNQTQKLNDDWHHYYSNPLAGQGYHYVVECRIGTISIGAENRSESTRTESKEVEVRKEEVRDTSGRVIDTKTIYENVSAEVHELSLTKNASSSLSIEIRNIHTNAVVFSQNLPGRYEYSESASYYSGDSRALTTAIYTMSASLSSPSDSTLVNSLMSNLQSVLFRFLKKNMKDL